ncbi:MAG: immunoglobulin domain-containing protein, partial [Candidatus Parvarchaeota archaeon]
MATATIPSGSSGKNGLNISSDKFVAHLTLYDGGSVALWTGVSNQSGSGGGTVTISMPNIPSSSVAYMALTITDVSQSVNNGTAQSNSGFNLWESQTVSITIGTTSGSVGGTTYYYITWDSVSITTSTLYTQITISPTEVSMDTSQSTTLTASLTGSGSTSPTYTWYLDGASTGSNSSSLTLSGLTAGEHLVYCELSDTVAGYAYQLQSNYAFITVYSEAQMSMSISSTNVNVGQPIEVQVNMNGGSGNFTYTWYYNGSSGTSVTTGNSPNPEYINIELTNQKGNMLLYYPTTGSISPTTTYYMFAATVVDVGLTTSHTYNAPNSSGNFSGVTLGVGYQQVAVYTPLAASINPLQNSVSTSSSAFSITGICNGGSGNLTWKLYENGNSTPTATGSGTTASYTFTPSTAGSFSFYYEFLDGTTSNITTTQVSNIVVTATRYTQITISPTEVSLDTSQLTTLTASLTGTGSGSPTYTWYSNGTVTGGNSSSLTFSPTTAGNYLIYCELTDTVGGQEYQLQSNYAFITVYNTATITTTINSTNLNVGEAVEVQVNVEGGSGDFTYTWYYNGSSGGTSSVTSDPTDITIAMNKNGSTVLYYPTTGSTSTYYRFGATVVDVGLTTPHTYNSTFTGATLGGGYQQVAVYTPLSASITPLQNTVSTSNAAFNIEGFCDGGSGNFTWKLY